jgi:hypothetical protein
MKDAQRACGSGRDGGDDFVAHGARTLAASFHFSNYKKKRDGHALALRFKV